MEKLYKKAKENNILIEYFPMQKVKALSIPRTIVINPLKINKKSEKKTCIAHELGHQCTNSFYRINSPLETKSRLEERATRWAVNELISAEDLKQAFKKGLTEVWQLAEYFEVTEDFIRDAVRVHKLRGDL